MGKTEEEPKLKKVIDGADGLSLGISIVVAVLLGVGLGLGMKNLFGIGWLLWLGVFWGVGGAILNVYKAYQKQKRMFDELAKDTRYSYNPNAKYDEDSDEKY
jgi:F0F1-type ATP synthase assembly protein I